MSNDYYNGSSVTRQTLARASSMNAIFTAIQAGFDRLPSLSSIWGGRLSYGADTGAADAYVVALDSSITSYSDGLAVSMKVANTNTGACTLNVNSIGAVSVKLINGTNPQAGDLTAGDMVDLRYNGTEFVIVSTVRSIVNGNASMSDADIKTAYENNADTNAFTDTEQTKLSHISVSQAVDLDTIETDVAASKTITDHIAVTQAVDLDTIETDLSSAKSVTDNITASSPINLDHISVSQSVDLDTMETDITAAKAITDYITVTQAVNLDTIETDVAAAVTELAYIAVTQAVDLDTIETLAQGAMPSSGGTFSGAVSFDQATFAAAIIHSAYNLTGTALDPANGPIQYKTLGSNVTLTDSLANGEAILLFIDDGSSRTATWPTATWLNADEVAPTLLTSGYNVFALLKVQGTLYIKDIHAG